MAIDSKLIFTGSPNGGKLVFGETEGASAPPAAISGDDPFDDEDLATTGQLLWDAGVSRGERYLAVFRWQDGLQTGAQAASIWQEGLPVTANTALRWQDAILVGALAAASWQESRPISARIAARWQDGIGQRSNAATSWQEGQRLRAMASARWQDGVAMRHATRNDWQEAIRLRRLAATRWQDASAMRRQMRHSNGPGIPVRILAATHWQDAMRPPAGLSQPLPPIVTPVEPCYDPAALGLLVFDTAWVAGDGQIVFVCKRSGGVDPYPPAAVVVHVRSTYVVENNVTFYRLPAGIEFEASNFTLDADTDSWTFGWSASLPIAARVHLARSAPRERVEVECVVNGVHLRLTIDGTGRDRSFPEDRIAVRGRGLAAELDDATLTFGNAAARTAQQLMADVLTVNGVSIGWGVDWQIEDWLVPANAWLMRGTYIDALKDIAGAAGAYLQPHFTDKVLRVLPRYAKAPWHWATELAVDIELPVEATSVVNTDEVQRPDYNRVFVGGVSMGVFGPVTRDGTAGETDAPPISHALITASEVHRQRGLAELSDTGLQVHHSLTTLVLPETGIIMPGKVIRYTSEDGPALGIVRKANVNMSRWPMMHQTLGVETHVE